VQACFARQNFEPRLARCASGSIIPLIFHKKHFPAQALHPGRHTAETSVFRHAPSTRSCIMFMLLGGNEKKGRREKEAAQTDNLEKVKEIFGSGRFPVVTTQVFEGRPIAKVLGLVCCRGFDSEEAFFGMAALAMKKGAQGIIGYSENVAFHPDGSKSFSCFGTAVMFAREARCDLTGISRSPATRGFPGHFSQDTAEPATLGRAGEQPSEEEDPVLQRLLASQRRSATDWQ
jgi:uncharacterized protein YbjQ (UPF0145 family)